MSDEKETADAAQDRAKQPDKPTPMRHIISGGWSMRDAEGKEKRKDPDEEADAKSGVLDNMPKR